MAGMRYFSQVHVGPTASRALGARLHGPVTGEMLADAALGAKITPGEMGLARLTGISSG